MKLIPGSHPVHRIRRVFVCPGISGFEKLSESPKLSESGFGWMVSRSSSKNSFSSEAHPSIKLRERFNRLFSIFNHDNKVWVTTDKGRFIVDFVHKDFLPASLPIKNHIVFRDTINDVFWTISGNTFNERKNNGAKGKNRYCSEGYRN